MPIQKAKDHYLGKNNLKRLNCAQSILGAFQAQFSLPDKVIEEFFAYGGGRSPGGVCGAYYAAKYLLEKQAPEKAKELDKLFHTAAGSLACKEIRALKKLSCLGCVEKAAEIVHHFIPGG